MSTPAEDDLALHDRVVILMDKSHEGSSARLGRIVHIREDRSVYTVQRDGAQTVEWFKRSELCPYTEV